MVVVLMEEIMNHRVVPPSVTIAPSIVVDQWLRQNGYVPANVLGIARAGDAEEDAIGILVETGEKPKKRFFGLWIEYPRRPWLGTLWIENGPRGAGDGRWLLEVNGSSQMERATALAANLMRLCAVRVEVRLIQATSALESFFSDIDGD